MDFFCLIHRYMYNRECNNVRCGGSRTYENTMLIYMRFLFFFSESVCRRWLSTWFSPLTMKTGPDSRRNGDYFTILETMIMVNREREKKNSGGDNAQWGDKRKAITIGKSFLHFDRLPSAGWCKLSGRRRCCLEPPLLVTLRWSSRAASARKLFLP